jgi:Ca-activated chloride channel family protein
MVGMETREFVYETTFPDKSTTDKGFVEHLWARRKVGYLMDQIRANGEKKELVDEAVALAKKYGIATPYTSYLIVPDGPVPVANAGPGRPNVSFNPGGGIGGGLGGAFPYGLMPPSSSAAPMKVAEYARQAQNKPGDLARNRGTLEDKRLGDSEREGGKDHLSLSLLEAKGKKEAYDKANAEIRRKGYENVQSGKLGVDLSIQMSNLRNQSRLELTAQRNVNSRNCLEIGGVWIDEAFEPKMPTLVVKAQSDAYFRILERQPKMKEVFQLGNHLVWVAPNGTALVIDTSDGKEKLEDEEIDKLFVVKK